MLLLVGNRCADALNAYVVQLSLILGHPQLEAARKEAQRDKNSAAARRIAAAERLTTEARWAGWTLLSSLIRFSSRVTPVLELAREHLAMRRLVSLCRVFRQVVCSPGVDTLHRRPTCSVAR